MKRYRGVIFRLVILFGSTVSALLLAEGCLRLFRPELERFFRLPKGLYQQDPARGWKHTPGFQGPMRIRNSQIPVVTDRYGLRIEGRDAEPGGNPVLFLGDSFVFGYGVRGEDTLSSVCERTARKSSPELQVRCLNSGVCAYSLPQYGATLESLTPDLQPRVALVCLYVENDFGGAWVPEGSRWLEGDRPGFGQAGGIVYSRSHLYRLIKHSRMNRAQTQGFQYPLPVFDTRANMKDPLTKHIQTELDLIRTTCRKSGIQMGIVILPCNYQVDPKAWEKLTTKAGVAREDYDILLQNRILRQWAQSNQVPCLDLQEVFSMAAEPAGLFIPVDRHFNEAGHKMAGESIAKWLMEYFTFNRD